MTLGHFLSGTPLDQELGAPQQASFSWLASKPAGWLRHYLALLEARRKAKLLHP